MSDDPMGHPENITNSVLENLAKKWVKSFDETRRIVLESLENDKADENPDIKDMFLKASKAWGQSIEEAKANTKDLLKQELG